MHPEEKTRLALALLFVEIAMFFGFIAIGAYFPQHMAVSVTGGSTITVAFLYGLIILVASVLLTGFYVTVENRREQIG
ncbi:DUF485 domain-containing protein [Trinickia sp.]|uniref:DUF485 domain-containing protein n=1 Tax=Trinickia sp. TaxID=2571163 RepID=UPI002D7E80E3|nr:DUF485 domain-containing protein [Trinickia sp.]